MMEASRNYLSLLLIDKAVANEAFGADAVAELEELISDIDAKITNAKRLERLNNL